jgi:hypothetical protein
MGGSTTVEQGGSGGSSPVSTGGRVGSGGRSSSGGRVGTGGVGEAGGSTNDGSGGGGRSGTGGRSGSGGAAGGSAGRSGTGGQAGRTGSGGSSGRIGTGGSAGGGGRGGTSGAAGNVGGRGGGGGTTSISTAAEPCTPAKTVTGGQTGNFETTGAFCFKTTDNISGWGCSNFDGRTLKVNGTAITCGTTPLPAKVNGGYYFDCSAGTYTYAAVFWY